jgi:S-adenosyl methyltransferase
MADKGTPPEGGRDAEDEARLLPLGVDPSIPSPARIYDYCLGGKDNYEADRKAAEEVLSVIPGGRRLAQANKYFLMRAVLLMADEGVKQFIDLGTGMPARPSVHELAQVIHPDARVLYVDNNAVVTAHNRALLAKAEGIEALQADIREPAAILASPELRRLIDFTQPVGVLFVAVLHFIPDSDDPRGIVAAFTSRMVPGSYLALSHVTSDGAHDDVVATVHRAYATASAPAVFRSEEEIRAFFSGYELMSPGLADLTKWYPYLAAIPTMPPVLPVLAGIGRRSEA